MTQFDSLCLFLAWASLLLQVIQVVHPLAHDMVLYVVPYVRRHRKGARTKRGVHAFREPLSRRKGCAEAQFFGAQVRQKRLERGWTRPQLVREMDARSPGSKGPALTTIVHWEQGHCLPSRKNLAVLCAVFDLAKEDLGISDLLYVNLKP